MSTDDYLSEIGAALDDAAGDVYVNNGPTTYVTNVTNIVNCSRVDSGHGKWRSHGRKRHGKRRGGDGHGKPPKLFRFCASCGIMDQDVAYGMSDGEMLDGAVDVVKYSAHGLSRCAGRFARGVSHDIKRTCRGIRQIFSSIFGD